MPVQISVLQLFTVQLVLAQVTVLFPNVQTLLFFVWKLLLHVAPTVHVPPCVHNDPAVQEPPLLQSAPDVQLLPPVQALPDVHAPPAVQLRPFVHPLPPWLFGAPVQLVPDVQY